MKNDEFNLIDSVLIVKASGSLSEDIQEELKLPEGKTIASLINEQEEKE
jgi:hypothetical protein